MSVVTPNPPVAARLPRGCIWWVLGGCALIVVVVIAGAFIGGAALFHYYQQGGLNCLPSDFPAYPGLGPGSYDYQLNGATPGSSCHMVFHLKDSDRRFVEGEAPGAAVYDFYQIRLSRDGWQTTTGDLASGHIGFRNTNRVRTSGTVDFVQKDGYTEITVQLYS
jgi:hypothetical protein